MFRTIERRPPHTITTRYFSEREALHRVGRFVRASGSLSFIEQGTVGRVVEAAPVFSGAYTVVVQWNVPCRYKPPLDWFSRNEYETLLEEVHPPAPAAVPSDVLTFGSRGALARHASGRTSFSRTAPKNRSASAER